MTAQAASIAPGRSTSRGGAQERALDWIVSKQESDGSWAAPGGVGAASTAQVAICLEHAGFLSAEDAASAAGWLAGQARADGGFELFAGSDGGDAGATACAAAFLRRHGGAGASRAAERAEAFVAARGGPSKLIGRLGQGDLSALLLAMAGALDPARLPDTPLWPLTWPVAERWFLRHFHGGILMTLHAVRLITRDLQRGSGARAGGRLSQALEARERERGLHWLSTFQNPAGSWNAWAPVTALHLAALVAAGVPRSDPRVQAAAGWLRGRALRGDGGLHWDVFGMPHWATTFNIVALLEAGLGPDHPALERARSWLLAAQCTWPQAEVNRGGGEGPRVGGFAYCPDNPVLVDCDDTAVALSALGALRRETRPDRRAPLDGSIARATAWLLGMQNDDGGFAAYVHGQPGKNAGPLFVRGLSFDTGNPAEMLRLLLRPPLELADPSTEDVTGRVLHGLGAVGLDRRHPQVARALVFLRRQQMDDGSFWGRWSTNYLTGTSYAIRGALAVGEPGSASWLVRAAAFLCSRQRQDGAWGESVLSYRDPTTYKGRGEPCAALTGRVLCALLEMEAADPRSPDRPRWAAAIDQGLAWLRDTQAVDGSWDGSRHLCALYPPDTFYVHTPSGTSYPLAAMALARRRPGWST
jgi:squalene-hopene/tetraprenyl-beta-curcumene cyclase